MDTIYTVCSECGCLVADVDTHTSWHATQTEGPEHGDERP